MTHQYLMIIKSLMMVGLVAHLLFAQRGSHTENALAINTMQVRSMMP